MDVFLDVWDELMSFLSHNRVVRVCGVGDFTVIDFSDAGLFVMSRDSSEPELVKREWIEAMWRLLEEEKSLCPDDLTGRLEGGLWSSFILSLLSYLHYVSYSWDGVRSRYSLSGSCASAV